MTSAEDSGAHALPDSFRELEGLQGIYYEMPPRISTLYARHSRAHVEYATTVLGDSAAAKAVVRALYTQVALNWDTLQLEEAGLEAYVWRALKLRVQTDERLTVAPAGDSRTTTSPAEGRTTAIHDAVVRAKLGAMRSQLADIDSPLGLYTAIATLPERQFDMIILNYVLGYSVSHVADVMGISAGTARFHRRQARKHLAAKLDIRLSDTEEKE